MNDTTKPDSNAPKTSAATLKLFPAPEATATALVSVIGLEEIMRRSQIAVSLSKEPFHFFLIAAFIYLSLTVLAMTAMHFLEKRASRGFKRSAS